MKVDGVHFTNISYVKRHKKIKFFDVVNEFYLTHLPILMAFQTIPKEIYGPEDYKYDRNMKSAKERRWRLSLSTDKHGYIKRSFMVLSNLKPNQIVEIESRFLHGFINGYFPKSYRVYPSVLTRQAHLSHVLQKW